jgi:hypothetical protein
LCVAFHKKGRQCRESEYLDGDGYHEARTSIGSQTLVDYYEFPRKHNGTHNDSGLSCEPENCMIKSRESHDDDHPPRSSSNKDDDDCDTTRTDQYETEGAQEGKEDTKKSLDVSAARLKEDVEKIYEIIDLTDMHVIV